MTDPEYRGMRVDFPFPWTERVLQHPRHGGLIQVIAANGREVPLFTMVNFLKHITHRLSQATAASSPANPASPGASA